MEQAYGACDIFYSSELHFMSQQPDAFLQLGASYNFEQGRNSQYRSRTIEPGSFQKWTGNNMYKSSYAHFHSKDSVVPKNTAIPGYGGYIPSVKAENIHAKGYANLAKESFHQDKLGKNAIGLSTTGFNLDLGALIDRSKVASSHKYGKTELQRAHPGWNARWGSTTHASFHNPGHLPNPCHRETGKWLQTQQSFTKGSGYSTNHAYLDGKGWKPDAVLRGDNHRSEYRDRFNADLPFHRNVNADVRAQLKKKEHNYKYN